MSKPTFKQFLTEQDTETEAAAQAVESIVRDCQPYLKDIDYDPGKYMLHRGMPISDPFVTKKVRKGRKPTDMPDELHDMIDSWMDDELDAPFRSYAIFASGSEKFAKRYGTAYIIFPIGQYQFAWSQKAHDLYDKLENAEIIDHMHTAENQHKFTQELEQFLDSLNYQTTDMQSAIKSGHEIMIHCERYYAVNKSLFDQYHLDEQIKKKLG